MLTKEGQHQQYHLLVYEVRFGHGRRTTIEKNLLGASIGYMTVLGSQ